MSLITCGDHRQAPACIVCRHISEGTALEAVKTPALPGEQSDYLCPVCAEHPWNLGIDDIVAVCIHCVRELTANMKVTGEDDAE